MKLLIIADDLTGALDTGVQFVKRGMRTEVIVCESPALAVARTENADVLVCDMESRHLTAEAAYQRVATAVRQLFSRYERSELILYVKTDSTQRGNIGAYFDAALDGAGLSRLFYAPAYPQQGRTTQDGKVYVYGRDLCDGHFGNDPFSSVRSSYLPSIISEQSSRETDIVTLERFDDWMAGDSPRHSITVFDAQEDRQLNRIASQLLPKYGKNAVYAGSAGLADALACALCEGKMSAPSVSPAKPHDGKFMIVSGSLHPVADEQVTKMKAAGIPSVQITEESITRECGLSDPVFDRLFLTVYNLFETHDAVVVEHAACDAPKKRETPQQTDDELEHIRIAIRTGELTTRVMRKLDLKTLVIIGGDTLFGVLRGLSCVSILPRMEILPGVALSDAWLPDGTAITIVTKSGGFGQPDTMMRIVDFLTKPTANEGGVAI